jgi:threonine-phosphate decarboxylase
LVERLAGQHAVGPDQVVVGNGSNDLIYAAARAFRPRRAAIVEPTYTEYLRASLRAGAAVEHWLAEGPEFAPEPFDPEGADLVWVGNPNNPTGRLWPPGSLAGWAEAFPKTLFIIDEAFLPFRSDELRHTLVPAVSRLPNVIVLRSLTKLYTLPGLRLGYAVASPELISRLREEIVPWSVNALAQVAGLVALRDAPFLAQTRAWFTAHAEPFVDQLRACSPRLDPLPSQANFVLVRVHGIAAEWLAAELADQGIGVRPATNFIGLGEHFLRMAARGPGDNGRLLAALKAILER